MTDHQNEDFRHLARAVALSREHMNDGAGGPFGAVIVRDGQVLAEGWNQVTSTNDPTAHAEVTAIRRACEAVGRFLAAGRDALYQLRAVPHVPGLRLLGAGLAHRLCQYPEDAAEIGFDDSLIYEEIAKPVAERVIPMDHVPSLEAQGGVRRLGGQGRQGALLGNQPPRSLSSGPQRPRHETTPCPASPPSSASPP